MLAYSLSCFYAYFYPMKYREEIEAYSQEFEVDPALVASVINVESGYDESAKSSKGAEGLMQILPSTGEWLTNKLGEKNKDLFDAKNNIRLGTFYLSYLLDLFANKDLALCAYNAGQRNVQNWLSDKRYSFDGKTLFKIPFEETQNYLKKVNKNYAYYKNRYAN